MADKYIRKRDAIDMCGGYGELARMMSRIKNADVLPYSIDPDGTLTITVPKDAQVGRVLVQEEGTQWGGLFYPDSVPVVRCDDCKYRGSRRWCELHSTTFDDNSFCSYGEKSDG